MKAGRQAGSRQGRQGGFYSCIKNLIVEGWLKNLGSFVCEEVLRCANAAALAAAAATGSRVGASVHGAPALLAWASVAVLTAVSLEHGGQQRIHLAQHIAR